VGEPNQPKATLMGQGDEKLLRVDADASRWKHQSP
jgi:hypothetical protein